MEIKKTSQNIANQIKQLEQDLCGLQNECMPHDIETKLVCGSLKRICSKCLMDCGYSTDSEKEAYFDK